VPVIGLGSLWFGVAGNKQLEDQLGTAVPSYKSWIQVVAVGGVGPQRHLLGAHDALNHGRTSRRREVSIWLAITPGSVYAISLTSPLPLREGGKSVNG
jgi:hypothetical protein